jgi:hypothetical protein
VIVTISKIIKRIIRLPLIVVGLLFILGEEFIWAITSRLTAQFARIPIISRFEAMIAKLPPYVVLPIFSLPYFILLPLKGLGAYWMATGRFHEGFVLLLVSEVVSVATIARLYVVCRPSLQKLGWFLVCENFVLKASQWAHEKINSFTGRFFNKKLTARIYRIIVRKIKRFFKKDIK